MKIIFAANVMSTLAVAFLLAGCGASVNHDSQLTDWELRYGEFLQESIVVYKDVASETVKITSCPDLAIAEDGESLDRRHCRISLPRSVMRVLGVVRDEVPVADYDYALRRHFNLEDAGSLIAESQSLRRQLDIINRDVNELTEVLGEGHPQLRALELEQTRLANRMVSLQNRINISDSRSEQLEGILRGLQVAQRRFAFVKQDQFNYENLSSQIQALLYPFTLN